MINKLKFAVTVVFVAIPLCFSMAPAKAQEGAALGIFFGALSLAQSQVVSAEANYYDAIGMGKEAQQYNRLAQDFKSGSLGGQGGVDTFTQVNARLANDIYELQAAGAYPTVRQRELAKRADEQLLIAKLAIVAAAASGAFAAVNSNGSVLEKILLGVSLAAIGIKVGNSVGDVIEASNAYRDFELGSASGFQTASKEIMPKFLDL